MSKKGFIDNALYRPLNSGSRYNGVIPASTCKSTFLGKGDTFFSMDAIKASIEKNYTQVEKLAPLLRRQSLQATCTAIYEFLYSHVQYKADGADQNLRGPACSWAVREKGVDCKSFSIFAGSILMSMGINHYVRKIKQPYMAPEEFTHVYIIVPKDQKTGSLSGGYHVIDATKHQNTEAVFTEKNDVYMSLAHYGLQAPAPARPYAAKRGLNGADTSTAASAFCKFTTMLKQWGVKREIVDGFNQHIRQEVAKGFDPRIRISKQGLIVERTFYPFIDANDQIVNIPDFAVKVESEWGLNGGKDGDVTILGETYNYKETYTAAWDGAKNYAKANGKSWLNTIFSKIKDFLGCIGASATPKTVENWREHHVEPWVRMALEDILSMPPNPEDKRPVKIHGIVIGYNSLTSKINNFLHTMGVNKEHQLYHKVKSSARCSKDANQAMADYCDAYINLIYSTIEQMKTDYEVSYQTVELVASDHLAFHDTNWKGDRVSTTKRVYTFKLKPGRTGGVNIDPIGGYTGGGTNNTGSGTTNTGGGTTNTGGGTNNTGGGTTNTGGGTSTTTTPFTPIPLKNMTHQKAGMNNILMFGLVAGGIYMAYKNKNKK